MEYPKNYWYPILESKYVKNKPYKLKRFEKDLVLFRKSDGTLVCLNDRCPHRGTSLALGKVINNCIECPMHGFQFSETGKCTRIPANGDQCHIPTSLTAQNYIVREGYCLIWLWWGEARSQLPELPWPKELNNTYPYWSKGSCMTTPVSFYRTMESGLDVIHFPFTHRPNALQAFLMRKLSFLKKMDLGPICDLVNCKVENQVIDLTWRLRWENQRGEELPQPMQSWTYFPAQMVVEVTDWKARGYFACCPIDAETTYWAVRYYQGFLDIPILGPIAAWVFLHLYVLGPITAQDIRLQRTQLPKAAGWLGDHLAARADQGIREYWKLAKNALERQGVNLEGQPISPKISAGGRPPEIGI